MEHEHDLFIYHLTIAEVGFVHTIPYPQQKTIENEEPTSQSSSQIPTISNTKSQIYSISKEVD